MYRPPRPTGNSREARFMQWMWDEITRMQQISGGPGVAIDSTTRGITVTVTKKQQGATVQQQTSGDLPVWL